MQYYSDYNASTKAYVQYIDAHVENVVKSWNEILKPRLVEKENLEKFGITQNMINSIDDQMKHHDASKWFTIEFEPYMNNFYPTCEEDKNAVNQHLYDLAWLHHQHSNPHHYQYWVLFNDSGEIKALDMDFNYICEMVCDWHSFSARFPDSTAKVWYDKNKDKMLFSDKTRATVEALVELMTESLTKRIIYSK